jgi:hypothetical protein
MAKKIEKLPWKISLTTSGDMIEKINEVIDRVNELASFCPLPDDVEGGPSQAGQGGRTPYPGSNPGPQPKQEEKVNP